MEPIVVQNNKIVWTPSQQYIQRSNIMRFMERHGIKSYEELIARSTADLEWFWDAVAKDLGIEWFTPYKRVLDISAGLPWAKWFVGGKLNIVHNCVDRHAASLQASKMACIWEGEDGTVSRLTYQELAAQSCRMASALRSLNIQKGNRVGIFMPMTPETLIAAYACSKIGAVWIPIFSGYEAQAVVSRLNDCEAKAVFTSDGFLRKGHRIEMKTVADQAVALCPSVRHVIVHRRLGSQVPWEKERDIEWEDCLSGSNPDCATEWMDSEDPLFIAYTSGTTGKPKGAVHVHGGFLVKIAQEVAYQIDLHEEDILFWFTDMGWIMGPWEMVGAGALGGTIFLYEGAIDYPGPDRLWDMIERYKITILGISPTVVRALMRYGEEPVRKHDLRSLRILGSTGEPWNEKPWRWYFDNVGKGRCPIINISGGTEIGACLLSPLPILPLKPCTLGGPALGIDLDVFDEQGQSVKESGRVGELVVKRPWPAMTRGIWKNPQRYLETYWSRWPNVWVHGDWASVDEDGYWYLHGRSDDTLKIAGKRMGPAEMESALVSHPAVSEAAAIGIPHTVKGEVAVCLVILKPGYEPTEPLREELKHHVEKQLGKAFSPDTIKYVKDLPRTRNAKIMRRLIKAKYLGNKDLGDLSSLENPAALEEIAKAV